MLIPVLALFGAVVLPGQRNSPWLLKPAPHR